MRDTERKEGKGISFDMQICRSHHNANRKNEKCNGNKSKKYKAIFFLQDPNQ